MAKTPRRAAKVGVVALGLLLIAGVARKLNVPARVRDRVNQTRKV